VLDLKKFFFIVLLISANILYAGDECGGWFGGWFGGSDFSTTLNSSTTSYSNSDNAGSKDSGWNKNTDSYYVSIEDPGSVEITVTGNQIKFSYSEDSCPSKGDSPDSTTATYNFSTATDFNLKVYRSSGSSKDYTITINFTPSVPQEVDTLVDYRFDECEWDGTSGEVVDSANGDYNATIQNGANTESNLTVDGGICRVGDFIDGDKALLVDGDISLPNKYTITLWAKFPIDSSNHNDFSGKQYYNIADRPGPNSDYIYFKKYSNNWKLCVYGNNYECLDYNDVSTLTGWHYLVFKVSNNGTEYYLDANSTLSFSQHPNGGKLGLVLNSDYGSNSDNQANGQSIGAYVDEFKIFNSVLSDSQINEIYDNEKDKKNYDGTIRNCPNCTPPPTPDPIVNYQMDECQWDGTTGEVKDSSGNGYDATAKNENNTTASGRLCRAGKFDGIDDYIKSDDIYDYLKTTASLSFWIKTTQVGNNTDWRAPGITGVEETGGSDDIFWGWLDANGHIGISKGNNDNDSSSSIAINDNTWHHIVLMRDADNGDVKIYIDGSLDKSGSTDAGVVGTSFSSIGRIENTGNVSNAKYFNGTIDELKVYTRLLKASQVQDIYNNENNGKNYDGSSRTCNSCGGSNPPVDINGSYNAVSSLGADALCNAVNDWDNNLTTQVVQQDFDLFILAKDPNTNTPIEANITKAEVLYFNDGDTSGCSGSVIDTETLCTNCGETNSSGCLQVSNIKLSKAVRCIEVSIEGSEKNSTTSTDSNSTDNFAVRPSRFIINLDTHN